MALAKELKLINGAVTNYHRISSVELAEGRVNCVLESYISQEYRESCYNVDSTTFNFDITLEEEESMGIRALCYNKIKSLDSWADAVDC